MVIVVAQEIAREVRDAGNGQTIGDGDVLFQAGCWFLRSTKSDVMLLLIVMPLVMPSEKNGIESHG